MVHDDSIAYQRMAHEIASAEDHRDWMRLAEKWMHLFGNEKQAYSCMDQAEKAASIVDALRARYWIDVAKGWAEIFNRMSKAWRCMDNAEVSVYTNSDWEEIIETWITDFGDIDRAERCLRLAYNDAKRSRGDLEWHEKTQEKINRLQQANLSGNRRNRLPARDPAYHNMEQAEISAVTSTEWARLVMIWLQVFNERGKALHCLGKAELAAGGVEDWVTVANTWAQEFNDRHQAFWCLKQAVTIADSSDEWNTIADNLAAMGYSLRDQALNRKSS